MNAINKQLEFFRKKYGFTQNQVAMVLDVPLEAYTAFENGTADISAVQLARLCAYYEVKMQAFFSAPANAAELEKPTAGRKPMEKGAKAPTSQNAKKVSKARKANRKRDAGNAFAAKRLHDDPGDDGDEKRLTDLIAHIVVENIMREMKDKSRLKGSPDGYHYEDEKPCVVCQTVVSGENSWFDRNGLKCMHCQRAIEQGIIPWWVTKSKDSFYTEIQLELNFGMKAKLRRSFKEASLLHSRVIPKVDGTGKHFELFLRSDNRDFLPPHKKLRVGGPVKETTADGREEYVLSYPWYFFVDPLEHLKDYGIARYLRFAPEENKDKKEQDAPGEAPAAEK